MSITYVENNNKPYYDVRYKENNKNKHAKFSIEKYGKYAKVLAEYANDNSVRLKNWYEEKEEYFIIHTYSQLEDKYYEILVDKSDFNIVKDYYWAAEKSKQEYYAITKINKNTKVYMHRLIMQPKTSDNYIDHIKGNGLNNRRNNLRIVDLKTNNKNRVNVQKNNNTGINGITKRVDKRNGYESYRVSWTDKESNKTKFKLFSCNKYGDDEALRLAIEFRKQMEFENY